MSWAAPVLSSSRLYQPLWSGPGVDDITGFYCTEFRRRWRVPVEVYLVLPSFSRRRQELAC